jgi:hypothetical protein
MATSISKSIREERATRKNGQLATAQGVAMKMGRRLRCSSVTYRFGYAPSSRLAGEIRFGSSGFGGARVSSAVGFLTAELLN